MNSEDTEYLNEIEKCAAFCRTHLKLVSQNLSKKYECLESDKTKSKFM